MENGFPRDLSSNIFWWIIIRLLFGEINRFILNLLPGGRNYRGPKGGGGKRNWIMMFRRRKGRRMGG